MGSHGGRQEGAVRSSFASLRGTGGFSESCVAPIALFVELKHAPQGFQRRAGGCPAPCGLQGSEPAGRD